MIICCNKPVFHVQIRWSNSFAFLKFFVGIFLLQLFSTFSFSLKIFFAWKLSPKLYRTVIKNQIHKTKINYAKTPTWFLYKYKNYRCWNECNCQLHGNCLTQVNLYPFNQKLLLHLKKKIDLSDINLTRHLFRNSYRTKSEIWKVKIRTSTLIAPLYEASRYTSISFLEFLFIRKFAKLSIYHFVSFCSKLQNLVIYFRFCYVFMFEVRLYYISNA